MSNDIPGWPAHVQADPDYDRWLAAQRWSPPPAEDIAEEPSTETVIDHYARWLEALPTAAPIDYHSEAPAQHTHFTACGWW